MDKKQENKIRYMRKKAAKTKGGGRKMKRLSVQAARFFREQENS